MNIVLEPDMKQWVDEEARRAGITPETFITQRLREQRDLLRSIPPASSRYPIALEQEYKRLIDRELHKTLTPQETIRLQEVCAEIDRIDQGYAERQPINQTFDALVRRLDDLSRLIDSFPDKDRVH